MRTGQNKRMRGRPNNNGGGGNRKGPNPLTRSYESNGPDVKIRGTPHHVAEKYLQLARDAQISGDPVMAESYLQHAEHYFRIIATAQQAQIQAQTGQVREDDDEGEDDDDIGGLPDRFASPIERQPQPVPQPAAFVPPPQPQAGGQPQGNGQNRPNYNGDRNFDRNNGERFNERGPRPDRPFQERGDRNDRQQRDFRNRDQQRPYRDQNFTPQPAPVERDNRPVQEQPEGGPSLPAFITAPVRVNPPADASGLVDQAAPRAPVAGADDDAGQFHLRSRRRRRPVAGAEDVAVEAEAPKSTTPIAD